MAAGGVILALSIISAAATAYGSYQQYEAGQEAERIADQNALREEDMAREEARRLTRIKEIQMAEARLKMAAAGIDIGDEDSATLYLRELETIGQEEIDWIVKSGKYRAASAREQGGYAAQQSYAGMWGGFAQTAGSLGQGYYQYQTLQ